MQISFMPFRHRLYALISVLFVLTLDIIVLYFEIAYGLLKSDPLFTVIVLLPVALMVIVALYLYHTFYRISACRITLSSDGVECRGDRIHVRLLWSEIAEVGITYSTYGDAYKGETPPDYVLQNQFLYISAEELDAAKRKKVAALFRKRGNTTIIAVSAEGQMDKVDEALSFIKKYYKGEIVFPPK